MGGRDGVLDFFETAGFVLVCRDTLPVGLIVLISPTNNDEKIALNFLLKYGRHVILLYYDITFFFYNRNGLWPQLEDTVAYYTILPALKHLLISNVKFDSCHITNEQSNIYCINLFNNNSFIHT